MLLHELKSNNPRKYKKPRVGRGGKRGKTSGRGQKGQKSRAGHRIRPAERDLILRLPKLRGYNNKPQSDKPQVINLNDLSRLEGNIVSKQTLFEDGFVRNTKTGVKILGDGKASRAFTVMGVEVSEGARKKIIAAGGKVVSL